MKKVIFFLIKLASEPELLKFLAQTFQYVAVGGFISVIFEGNDFIVLATAFVLLLCGIVMLNLASYYKSKKEDRK